MQIGLQRLSAGGRCAMYVARKSLHILLLLAIVLAGLSNSSTFGMQSVLETQSKTSGTKIEGRVWNVLGEAIAGASVWLVNEMEEKVADARTDQDGKFVMTVALPGKYWLKVRKEGFRQARVELGDLSRERNRHFDVFMKTLERAKRNGKTDSNSKALEYSDEPNFTISGVADWNGAGL